MFSRSGARGARRAAPMLPLGVALLAGALIAPAPASAQSPDGLEPSRSALYGTLGVIAGIPVGEFTSTGGQAGGIVMAAVFPIPRDDWWITRALALRLEFSEVLYGSATYEGSDPRYEGDHIYAGIRTHAFGLQLTRPGWVRFRPYGSVTVGDVKMLLDTDELKLERQTGTGVIARIGSYLAFTCAVSPFVVELTAAYHHNGTRDHWREGSVTSVRGPVNFFELSLQLGFAVHEIW